MGHQRKQSKRAGTTGCLAHLTTLKAFKIYLFMVVVIMGVIFGMTADHDSQGGGDQKRWTFGKSLLFSVSAMSTAGIVSPEIDNGEMMFVGFFSIVGVVTYATAIGVMVDLVVNFLTDRTEKAEIVQTLTKDFERLHHLVDQKREKQLDKETFIYFQLEHMGKIDPEDVEAVKDKWEELDIDGSEMLSMNELAASIVFDMADVDDNGVLSEFEFQHLAKFLSSRLPDGANDLDWDQLFEKYDRDASDAGLSKAEFVKFWVDIRDGKADAGLEAAKQLARAPAPSSARPAGPDILSSPASSR